MLGNKVTKLIPARDDRLSLAFGALALAAGGIIGLLVAGPSKSIYPLVIVAIPYVAWAAITQTELTLLIFIFTIYTRFSDVGIKYYDAPSIAKPFIVLLILAIFIRWVLYGQHPTGWKRATLLVVGYGLVGFISLLYATDVSRVQETLGDFVKDAVIVIIIGVLLQRALTLRYIIWTLLAAGIFMGAISVYQHLTGTFTEVYWGFGQASLKHIVGQENNYRIGGPFGSPNAFAQVMLPLAALALGLLWGEQKPLLRILAAGALALSILTIVFTFSRNGFVVLFIVLGLMLVRRLPSLPVLLVTIVVTIPLLQFLPAQYTDRLATLTYLLPNAETSAREEISFRGRLSENMAGWLMFADHPLLGVGLANYPVYYQAYSRHIGVDPRREERGPHNLYLQIASEQGLLGLTVFGLMLGTLFYGMRRAEKDFLAAKMPEYAGIVVAFSVGLIGYLIAGTFIHLAYPRYFWLLVGIALAIPQVAQNELAQLEGLASTSWLHSVWEQDRHPLHEVDA